MNSLREVDGAEAMLVSSFSVTVPGTSSSWPSCSGRSLCLLYSVSHKQLIQLARRGQPDQLGADLEASQTLERRADGPTPDPGYHAPLKQGDKVKLGLEQVIGGLERCWCASEAGRHLVPSSSSPASPAPPPALLSAGHTTQLAPGGRLWN